MAMLASGKPSYSALSIDTPTGAGEGEGGSGRRGAPTLASPSLLGRLTPRSTSGRTLMMVGVSCLMGCVVMVGVLYAFGRPSSMSPTYKAVGARPRTGSHLTTPPTHDPTASPSPPRHPTAPHHHHRPTDLT